MAIKSVTGIFDDAGNSDLSFRNPKEDWDIPLLLAELTRDEVLVALYWSEPGNNEEMKAAVIQDEETFREIRAASPEFLWQCWIIIPKTEATEKGLL